MAKHSLVFEKFPLRRGSRRGYNADVDDKPHSPDPAHPCDGGGDDDEEECEEDRTIIDSKQNGSNCRIQFYSHIKPKRRRIDDSTSRQQQKHSPWQSNKEKKKRTHYWTTTLTHPDIDLSLVPLSSSTELDQQTVITTGGCGSAGAFAYLSTIPTTTTTTTTTTCSSSSSFSSAYLERKTNGRSRTTFKDDDRGKKENFEHTNASSSSSLSDFNTKARPLAVVDYGSIELDMSGTLLDSIYKIVPPPTSSGGGGGGVEGSGNNGVGCTNWTGGRKRHRFSFAHSNYESIQSNRRKRSLAGDEEVNEASCDNLSSSPLFPYLNQGSTNSILSIEPNLDDTSCAVQVQATSPTLVRSGHPAHETTSSLTHEGGRTTTETQTAASINKECFDVSSPPAIITRTKMVEAGRMVHGPLPTISNVPTTLEAAISFSPFARVLFCAHPPYTVLHTNAAYVSLAQQRLLIKPCLVGRAFSNNTKLHEGESSETYVARMVMEHVQSLDPDHDDDEENARRPQRCGLFYNTYPVLPVDDPYREFLRWYRHDFERRQGVDKKIETSIKTNSTVLTDAAAAPLSITNSNSSLNISSTDELEGRSSSPIQHRAQYLLQIEPDGHYPY